MKLRYMDVSCAQFSLKKAVGLPEAPIVALRMTNVIFSLTVALFDSVNSLASATACQLNMWFFTGLRNSVVTSSPLGRPCIQVGVVGVTVAVWADPLPVVVKGPGVARRAVGSTWTFLCFGTAEPP